ncbi:MAG: heparinase II/III family protein [Oscillospiraceae bacterium]|nr:heparinase II/III family protein [Oscillospiraceae bacterium]
MTKIIATLLAVLNFLWYAPLMLRDTAAVGLDYLTLSHDLPKIPQKQMEAGLAAAVARAEHPFVLANRAEFARAKAELDRPGGDAYIKEAYAYAMEEADGLLGTAPCVYFFYDGERLLEVSREVLNRMVTLGFAWQMTGERKYAERGWAELEQVCGFSDWHPAHFLDTAEMALAVSVGYDWFFDFLTPAQKDLLAKTVFNYALTPGDPTKVLKLAGNWWAWSKTNWNSVCYGALGCASMAFADRYPAYAARFLRAAYYNMPAATTAFRPDGVYVEGNSYWEYGTSYLVYFIATSRSFLGTDYGLSGLPGFDRLGHFPLYISTPTGAFNTGDNRSFFPYAPAVFWFASETGEPMLSAYQRQSYRPDLPRPAASTPTGITQTYASEQARKFALGALWCDPALDGDPSQLDLPTCVRLRSDENQELVLMRSAYCDPQAVYAGIKAGYNYTNHGDLDIGTFVFESQGVRWFDELGKSDYNSPDYFNGLIFGGRWKNYRKRAEGHNTLVINTGNAAEDQYPYARARILSFENNTAVLDMTPAYVRSGVKSARREFQMLPGYAGVRITDRIACRCGSDIYWFAHTTAEIELAPDGRSAVLRKGGRSITVLLGENSGGVFTVMEAMPLPDSPARRDEEENREYKKLAVHLEGVKDAVIDVTVLAE